MGLSTTSLTGDYLKWYQYVFIKYENGDKCTGNTDKRNSFQLKLGCNTDLQPGEILKADVYLTSDECEATYELMSADLCPVLVANYMWSQVAVYINFLKVEMMIVASFFLLFGWHMRVPAACFMTFVTTVCIAAWFFWGKKVESPHDYDYDLQFRKYVMWGAFTGIWTGLIVGAIDCVSKPLLAAWGGFCFSLVVYEAFIFYAG